MIKNIVFDMGNVLVRYAPANFISAFAKQPEHQQLLLNEIFGSVEWLQADRGTITKEEMKWRICQRVPEMLHSTVSEILAQWFEEIQPIADMRDVVSELKAQGYRLYILSNASQDYYQFRDIIPGIEFFDGEFVSSDWKLLKPEKEIYKQFFSHFQLVPSECYFIDDMAMNVEAARNSGMVSHIFRGNIEELQQNFKTVGIKNPSHENRG
ncbi:HAD family phosphatase [Vagococcus sp. BWB3-3]|uniref:HAD family phosphatase n=1 Tax=Vagococcus allomyrinae TaxID=2794353 RepID=A0A940SU50_9ENTE|nr:HAD family phosphatase [Vagococcus allomyrinae]MBP1039716.1 HAD family phosphatase [Vagococcus allomyrinae]